ncbi:hypothetical protein DFS34DRAFT_627062 [Phlyctochytrium arcticum]|nr:hypothetical protein DFS34DRAFT_627062 [Phlyctochytrium arcticum]
MLTSLKKQRSIRSIRSVARHGSSYDLSSSQNFTDMLSPKSSSSLFNAPLGGDAALKALHLPASIPSNDRLSPGLWTWIHSTGHGLVDPDSLHLAAAQTKLVSAVGEAMEFPEHLLDVSTVADEIRMGGDEEQHQPMPGARALPGMTRPMPGGSLNISSGKLSRRPVSGVFGNTPDVRDTPKVRRLYLQIDDLKIKTSSNTNVAQVHLQIAGQRAATNALITRKESSKGFGLSASPKEGFIFDTEDHDSRVTLRVLSVPSTALNSRLSSEFPSQLSASPSLDNVPAAAPFAVAADPSLLRPKMSLLSGLRRSPTASSLAFNAFGGASGSSTPTRGATVTGADGGQLLGEVSFMIPSRPGAGAKIPGEYTVMALNGKKEIAKVMLQIGVFLDEDYNTIVQEPVSTEPEFTDYLNFLIHVPGGAAIWRKYWCILRESELQVYDFEYREAKPVASIALAHILQVRTADPEYMCAPNSIEVLLSPQVTHNYLSHEDELTTTWTNQILDTKPCTGELLTYVTADSRPRMIGWMDKIAREKARLAGAKTPVPPPRKMTTPKTMRKPVASMSSSHLARELAY